MNILIIEDDQTLAENIKCVFEKKIISNRIKISYDFHQFSRELWVIQSYDIVLVDIILWRNSQKNGIDIIKEIRKKSKLIPIVMVSWLDDITWLEKSFREWANDYIVKPFRLKELELRVYKWFETFFYMDLSGKNKISYEWLEFDITKNEFFFNKKSLPLTKSSKYLLSLFLSSPEKHLWENYLREKIRWDLTQTIDRNLRVNVMRLKAALKPFGIDHRIQNVRWEWYRIKK